VHGAFNVPVSASSFATRAGFILDPEEWIVIHAGDEQEAERARMRKTQVGTGDRSAKIRTYNYPQSRVTDHRIGFTSHNLPAILDGGVEPLIDALRMAEVEERT